MGPFVINLGNAQKRQEFHKIWFLAFFVNPLTHGAFCQKCVNRVNGLISWSITQRLRDKPKDCLVTLRSFKNCCGSLLAEVSHDETN